MTSKSFTFWSHLVLSPPATGFIHSQTSTGLAGRIPSPLYLRWDEMNPNLAALPFRASNTRGSSAGGDLSPRHLRNHRRDGGLTHTLPANSAEGLHDTETSLCGNGKLSAAGPGQPPAPPQPPRTALPAYRTPAAPPATGVLPVKPHLLGRRLGELRVVHGQEGGATARLSPMRAPCAPPPWADGGGTASSPEGSGPHPGPVGSADAVRLA